MLNPWNKAQRTHQDAYGNSVVAPFGKTCWDWVVVYLIPRPVWAWWMNHIFIPIKYRKDHR